MNTTIIWFRRDLRLSDNPALAAALQDSDHLLPVYIHDPDSEDGWGPGSAARWWLHHSLTALDNALKSLGSGLVVVSGDSLTELRRLVSASGARRVCWNRLYEPAIQARDSRIKLALRADGLSVNSFNGSLWFEPWDITRDKGEPYKVFTPFWKALQKQPSGPAPEPKPGTLPPHPEAVSTLPLASLKLLPTIAWDGGFHEHWQAGEDAAQTRLEHFIDSGVSSYALERDIPGHPGTSRLAPSLHFGELSPRQVLWRLRNDGRLHAAPGTESYIRELAWREFAHHLLFHFPETIRQPMDQRFNAFPWRKDYQNDLKAWQQGRTGIPVVDAGMRELWHTGWMHNRVRMIVASLLTKNLLIPWQEGADWFWDTLVDADLANNTLGWQWVAGSGADAAPYFRIFNPVLQGERFDPDGVYVRRWVPELATLPSPWIHKPWEAPTSLLSGFNIHLGRNYPHPIVDLKVSRERALEAFKSIKSSAESCP